MLRFYSERAASPQQIPLTEWRRFQSLEVVGLDQGDPGRVVFPAHDRGVTPGGERRHNDGFPRIAWRKSIRNLIRVRRFLPVVVRGDRRAVAIYEIEGRILQGIRDAQILQGRTYRAHDDLRASPRHDETANHRVVARLDEPACADVCELRIGALGQVVGFDNAGARLYMRTTDHSRVVAR